MFHATTLRAFTCLKILFFCHNNAPKPEFFRYWADMQASENALKWALRFYPPLFFQRIWVVKFEKGFRAAEVTVNKSFLNKNHDDSIFGGTIIAAADPFHPLLFSNALNLKGYNVKAWSRSAAVRFLKPAKTSLHFRAEISDSELMACEDGLKKNGRYRKSYQLEIFDKENKLCAIVINEMYIKDLAWPDEN